MDIRSAYRGTWSFTPPKSCREMHGRGLFDPLKDGQRALLAWLEKGFPKRVLTAVFEFYDAETIAEGDSWVTDDLVAGLVPIGGDNSGDRWCFDARTRVHGTTAILHCPHAGAGATYVAPSFSGFIFRLLLENLTHRDVWAAKGLDKAQTLLVCTRSFEAARPWLLRRWIACVEGELAKCKAGKWTSAQDVLEILANDPAFARLPQGEIEHFR